MSPEEQDELASEMALASAALQMATIALQALVHRGVVTPTQMRELVDGAVALRAASPPEQSQNQARAMRASLDLLEDFCGTLPK